MIHSLIKNKPNTFTKMYAIQHIGQTPDKSINWNCRVKEAVAHTTFDHISLQKFKEIK